jgi:outer membrane protein assembly factor BamB
VGSDGYLHALNVQNGWENMTPVLFLPANTRATGLIVATSADGSAVAYAATTHGCGSQPDGVWALDLGSAQKVVTAFRAKGATIAGSAGPAIGRDGTVYVATADGKSPMSNAIIALEPKTLKLKGSVTVPGAAFASSPLVFAASSRLVSASQDKDILAASGGGKLYLFDSSFLANGPIATSSPYAPPDSDGSALATWQDAQGTRWIATTSARGIVAMKVAEQDGKLTLASGWTSREIGAPLAPVVVNGVLFAGSAGARAVPGALYAMDAATGKELWNSGKSITSTVRSGLSAGQGNVYLPGADGTLYAFGFAIEK